MNMDGDNHNERMISITKGDLINAAVHFEGKNKEWS